MRYALVVPRSQLIVILVLALGCGIAAGVFVYFVASAPEVEARPAAVEPVHIANASPPSVVSLPTKSPTEPEVVPAAMEVRAVAASTKMKPEDEPIAEMSEMSAMTSSDMGPRSAASLAQRVHHARRQCHEMAERLCRCYPQTCAQQRDAHRNADRSVVESARNLERMPDALNQMMTQLEESCRASYAAVRRSMPQCF